MKNANIADCFKKNIWTLVKQNKLNVQFFDKKRQKINWLIKKTRLIKRTPKWALDLVSRPWNLKFVQIGNILQQKTLNLPN